METFENDPKVAREKGISSVWTSKIEAKPYPKLTQDISAEAVVIGGGMAGILTAFYLQSAGMDTVVVERGKIGGGQTTGTTAKITLQHGLIYEKLLRQFKSGHAKQYADANQFALDAYEGMIDRYGIDCDFERLPACLYTQDQLAALERELRAARHLEIPAAIRRKSELPFEVAGVLEFPDQAQFHPLKFLRAIAKNLTIYEQSPVGKVKNHTVFTKEGSVSAKYVIFCCHYPIVNFPGFYFLKMHQERSYVLALDLVEPLRGMYLGIDPGDYSFRMYQSLLLLGGEGHRTGCNKEGGQYRRLRIAAHHLYPEGQERFVWSAQDCMTLDGVPYIGRFSKLRPDWYVATGFGKWGMSSSMVAARVISDLILKGESPWQEVFSPTRFRWRASINNLTMDTLHSVSGLTQGIFSAPERRCNHLGCRLKWNPEEETYDCPCHGSRYDKEGNLLTEPAQRDCPRH